MRVLSLLLLPLLVLAALGAALAWLAVADAPAVATHEALTAADIRRARNLLDRHDPRELPDGARRELVLTQQDLTLVASYLADLYGGARARVEVRPGALRLHATRRLPETPAGSYLNLALDLVPAAVAGLAVGALRIGDLPVPAGLLQAVEGALLPYLPDLVQAFRELSRAIREVDIGEGRVRLTYEWRHRLLEEMRAGLLSPADRAEVIRHQQRLAEVLERSGRAVALESLLLEMLAADRLATPHPVAANRALLLVLTAHVNGRDLRTLVPEVGTAARRHHTRVKLQGRVDLAQHFLISAALAALGSEALADAIGLQKEVDDIDFGSGFSFTDLAADRAGTRFGRFITRSRERAAWAREQIARGRFEMDDVMPSLRGLPEFLSRAELSRRYGEVGSAAYEAEVARIEQRIGALDWYR